MSEIINLLFQQLKKIPKSYLFPIAVGCAGLILLVYGIINYLGENNSPKVPEEAKTQPQEPVKIVKKIFIDIEGAVQKPGVYNIASDGRVKDALLIAGGFSPNADKDFVEKHINLASKITDGAKIYIPRSGEPPASAGASAGKQISNDSGSTQTLGSNTDAVNINTARADQLDALPGIGQVTAQKIINGRPYSDTQELLSKKIVSQKVFNEIKDKITVL